MMASVLKNPPTRSSTAADAAAMTAVPAPVTALRPMFQAAARMTAVTAGRNPRNTFETPGIWPQRK
jgi:hypothetical protein